MAGTLSHDQTVFALSLMANLGSGLVGSVDEIETALTADLTAQLHTFQTEIGPWEVVWGPVIYQAINSDRADNAMFIAKDHSDPVQYIIAIAGTNPYSAFDWVSEDVFVARQVAWEYGNPPPDLKPAVADGTHLGLSILQQMRPGPSRPGNSATLQAFLQNLPAGKVSLTTAGHSLGGALSPVAALWLSDTQADWDPAGRATISCLPSAGPTPGNQDFATWYANSPLGARTTRIHNRLDVVPHAWAESDLEEVPTLYQPDIQPGPLVAGLTFLALQASKSGNYAQLDPNAPALPGTVDTGSIDPHADSFKNFVTQMTFQHVNAYFSLMGIDQFSGVLDHVRESAHLLGPQGTIAALRNKLLRRQLTATS
jgi:hypothetical protein